MRSAIVGLIALATFEVSAVEVSGVSSAFTINNPELIVSSAKMSTVLANIYFTNKCKETEKKKDGTEKDIVCSVVAEAGALLEPNSAMKVVETYNSLVNSSLMMVGGDSYYSSFINKLQEAHPDMAENEIVDKSIGVLGAAINGSAMSANGK